MVADRFGSVPTISVEKAPGIGKMDREWDSSTSAVENLTTLEAKKTVVLLPTVLDGMTLFAITSYATFVRSVTSSRSLLLTRTGNIL